MENNITIHSGLLLGVIVGSIAGIGICLALVFIVPQKYTAAVKHAGTLLSLILLASEGAHMMAIAQVNRIYGSGLSSFDCHIFFWSAVASAWFWILSQFVPKIRTAVHAARTTQKPELWGDVLG